MPLFTRQSFCHPHRVGLPLIRVPVMTLAFAACACMAGCANTPVATAKPDSFEQTVTKYADMATVSLRKIAEVDGSVKPPAPAICTSSPAENGAMSPINESIVRAEATAERPGRAGLPLTSTDSPKGYARISRSSQQLRRSASSDFNASTPIAGYVQSPQGQGASPDAPPPGLEQFLDVDWHHDSVESLLAFICKDIGWTKLPSKGMQVSPLLITIHADHKTAYDILKDIGASMGRSGDLVVSPASRSMYLQYPVH